jgi:N-acetylmuramoyl-L-alanine amidase/Extensin-like protein C-terminus
MSDTWFEGVGLAESPFANEVEAPTEAWASESVGLPPSWPEDEADGVRGEQPFATEAWTPWAPAEAWSPEMEELPFGEAEEQAPGAPPGKVDTGIALRRELAVPRVPLLASHRGRPPDLILRWNVPSVPEVIDVVVHLHGFRRPGLRLDDDIKSISGLDLTPVGGETGSGRSRPTLTVLPRGNDTGRKQKVRRKDGSLTDGPYNVFDFPALVTKTGLADLVRFSLERFAAELGGTVPRVGRLILTAHSGGGAALLKILKHYEGSHDPHHDPHQVHVFDALYQDAGELAKWARRRIAKDRTELAALGAASAREYMSTRGGALRVFYGGGTRKQSRKLQTAIASELDRGLEPWYRVERSRHSHLEIPKRHGWRVLADASADDPDAYTEPATRREVDLERGGVEAGPFDEWEEPEWATADLEAEDPEAEEELEGLLTHASEEALDRLEPLGDEAESPGADEEAPAGRGLLSRVLEQSILVAAIAAGERSEKVLTDKIFRLRHPDPTGTGITKDDEASKLKWRQIRDRQVLPLLLTGPFIGPMHGSLATASPGADLRKGVPADAKLSPLSISRRGLRKAKRRQSMTIAAIVVHNTSRGPANRSRERGFRRPAIEYALDHYLNGDEGYPHYVVDFNGTIYATCDERFVAWHAGWVHAGGKKLFSSGWKAPDWWSRVWSKHGAKTPIDLLPKESRSPNYRTIGIELLLLPDMSYTPQQYKALARLVVDIQRRNPEVIIPAAPSRGLLGHEDFAPVTGDGGRADAHGGWDPGAHRDRPFFDWQLLWTEIQAVSGGPGAGGKGAEAPELWAEFDKEDLFEPEDALLAPDDQELEEEGDFEGREGEEETGEEAEADLNATTQELAEPELGEVEDFLGERLEAQAGDARSGPAAASFPSGETLPAVSGSDGPGQEQIAMRLAIARGIRDESRLTDLVFAARHPERQGRRLQPDERPLIAEWLDIRSRLVRPALAGPAPAPAPAAVPIPSGAVTACPKVAQAAVDRCLSPGTQTCPAIPNLLCQRDVDGVPFEYPTKIRRDPTSGLSAVTTRQPTPRMQRFVPDVRTALSGFLDSMRHYRMPVEAILTAGSLYCRCISKSNRLSNHSFGDAIDIVGVRWPAVGGPASAVRESIVHNYTDPGQRALLRRINACLRLSFPRVIDYHSAGHQDHFHCDTNRDEGRRPRERVNIRFVQEALSAVLGRAVTVTGVLDRPTVQALGEFSAISPSVLADDRALDRVFADLFSRTAAGP